MVRSDLVVLPKPNIDSDLGLSCVVEPFSVEDFFSQGPVKGARRKAIKFKIFLMLNLFNSDILNRLLVKFPRFKFKEEFYCVSLGCL
jgi:hypothetical protein